MKLVTFATDRGVHIGALRPGEASVSDFTAASDRPYFADMLALIDSSEAGLDHARTLLDTPRVEVALANVRLLAPVPVPRQMFDCLCFEEHLLGSARASQTLTGIKPPSNPVVPEVFREIPVYYKCNRFSVVGTDTDIVRPRYCKRLDYELEFGVFLGRSCKNASAEEAAQCIFGYCIFNDVSARDQQMNEMRSLLGPSKGKDFDTGNVMGPWLVTTDEVPNPQNLTMSAYINGARVSSGTSAGMMHTFPEIIAYSSQDETRRAGEFFGSGTVGGGSGLETGRWLEHGDILELEIAHLGRLRNRIVFQDTGS